MTLSLDSLYLAMMVFVRAGGLMTLMPVFSGQTIPIQVRVAIAAMLALVVSSSVPAPQLPTEVIGLIIVAARELVIGLIMGMVSRFVFYCLELAGQIMATEIGLMMSAQIDPITRNNTSPVGLALFYFSSLLFLITGCHHYVIAAFVRSFELTPIGQLAFTRDITETFIRASGNIFLVAVQMSAPLIASNFIVTLTFAILGKASPSINVFAESFAVRVIVGLVVFGVVFGLSAQLVLSWMRQSPEQMLQLLP